MDLIKELHAFIDEARAWEGQRIFARNEMLSVEGAIERKGYFIIKGALRAFMVKDDEELTIRFGYKNEFFTALDSFLSGKPSTLFIQAIRKCEVKIISKDRLYEILHTHPGGLQLSGRLLTALILQQMQREEDLLTSAPAERYRRVLRRSPQLFQEIPKKYIASYLRMTPETLSRIRKS